MTFLTPRYPLLLLAFLLASAGAVSASVPWREVMGPPEGDIPAPYQDTVEWRGDLPAAFAEARRTNRPLFITFRCPPCDQCSFFDALVLRGSQALTPLYKQFVTARITDAAVIDHRIFKFTQFQDLDLSWWGYFLSPEGRIYGVYGGKDHVSDRTRINEESLVKTMERILAHHHDPRREGWGIDGPLPETGGSAVLPEDLPGAREYFSQRPGLKDQGCMHCHQVNDILYTGMMASGDFDKKRDIVPWPLPENVGITVDVDDGLLISAVEAGSPAEAAGLRPGDRIVVGEGRKLFSQADLRGILHRAPSGPTTVTLYYDRGGQPGQALIETSDGWKQAINFWRKSIYDGVFGTYPGFFPLKGPQMGKGNGLSIKPFLGGKQNHPVYQAGLRPNHEVVGVNGMEDDMEVREFMTWFRMNHEPGDEVVLTVRQGGRTDEIRYRLPAN